MNHSYRKRPVVVEAFRMTESNRAATADWPVWLREAWQKNWPEPGAVGPLTGPDDPDNRVQIKTPSGALVVEEGDWIVMQSPTDLYPVKDATFNEIYEDADAEPEMGPEDPAPEWGMIASGLPFYAALQMLHAGLRIAREGWNGKGQWVAMHLPGEGAAMERPFIFINPVDGQRVPWVASQTDILADDWCVFAS